MKYKVGDKVVVKNPERIVDWSELAKSWIRDRKIVTITSIEDHMIWLDGQMWFNDYDIRPAKNKLTIII